MNGPAAKAFFSLVEKPPAAILNAIFLSYIAGPQQKPQ